MAESKKFRWKLPSCFGSRRSSQSFLRKITNRDKRKYPAVAAILASGYGDEEYLNAVGEMYIHYSEAFGQKDIKWQGERDWNVIYFVHPSGDGMTMLLLDKPVSPYWFWHAVESMRSKHPEGVMRVNVISESMFFIRVIFPYGNYSVHKYGDYKTMDPEIKMPMDEFLRKYEGQIIHPQWL